MGKEVMQFKFKWLKFESKMLDFKIKVVFIIQITTHYQQAFKLQ